MGSPKSFFDLPFLCIDKIVQHVDLSTKPAMHQALRENGLEQYSASFIKRNQHEFNCPLCQFQVLFRNLGNPTLANDCLSTNFMFKKK